MNSSEQKSEGKVSTSVLVLGLNGKRYLERCLSSLSNQTYSDYKVIYIDAASTDGSSDYVRGNFPNVDILQLEANLGFTGGNNKGIEYAKAKYNSDFVVTINNDTWVEPDWLEKLLEPMSDSEVAVTTSLIFLYYPYIFVDFVSQEDAIVKNIYINKPEYRVLVYDLYKDTEFAKFPLEIEKDKKYKIAIPCTLINDSNNLIFESTQKLPITLNVGIVDYYSEENNIVLSRDEINENIFEIIQNAGSTLNIKHLYFQDNKIFERVKPIDISTHEYLPEIDSGIVDSGCGCSMAIRMGVIDELGWFDPTYFLYNEDNELCYRYSKAGYKIKLASKSIVHHYFWGSTDVISSAKIFYGVRNRLWFIKKYFGRKRFLYFWLRALGRTLDYAQKFDKIHFTNYLKALIHATR